MTDALKRGDKVRVEFEAVYQGKFVGLGNDLTHVFKLPAINNAYSPDNNVSIPMNRDDIAITRITPPFKVGDIIEDHNKLWKLRIGTRILDVNSRLLQIVGMKTIKYRRALFVLPGGRMSDYPVYLNSLDLPVEILSIPDDDED